MKKMYTNPELEITMLTAEDILSTSPEGDSDIFIDVEDLV